MTNDIDIQKLKSEYPDFFEQTPPDLLKFILSEETSFKIAEICLENGIENEEIIEKIAYRITLILLNQIPRENLAIVLEKGVQLDPETARKIALDVEVSLFTQIKTIGSKKIGGESQPSKPSLFSYLFPGEKPQGFLESIEEKPKTQKKDIHQEPI